MELNRIYLGLGGNLGNRTDNLEETIDFIEFNIGNVVRASSVYETEPWNMPNATSFLNQVVYLESALSHAEVMQEILELEEFFGRKRSAGVYKSREMDVDILFYNNEVIDEKNVQVPHPRLHLRKFVLIPLCEIAPDFVHPVFSKSIQVLLSECPDKSEVKLFNPSVNP